MEREKELLTREEAMNVLGVSSSTLYRWQAQGLIKIYKLGNRTYFRYSNLFESLEDYENKGQKEVNK